MRSNAQPKLKQNANEGCNSYASLAGPVLCFIACFILLVIAPLGGHKRKIETSATKPNGRAGIFSHLVYLQDFLKFFFLPCNATQSAVLPWYRIVSYRIRKFS